MTVVKIRLRIIECLSFGLIVSLTGATGSSTEIEVGHNYIEADQPAGNLFAFVQKLVPNPDSKIKDLQVVSVDPNTHSSKAFPVLSGERFRVSPNRQLIAYELRGGKVYVTPLSVKPTHSVIADVGRPSLSDPVCWSSDGSELVFSSGILTEKVWKYKSYRVRVKNSAVRALALSDRQAVWDWSSDGRLFAVLERDPISAGLTSRIVSASNGETVRTLHEMSEAPVRFSPDGRYVACSVRQSPNEGIWVWETNVSGSGKLFVRDQPGLKCKGVCWSPDSQWLAFVEVAKDEKGNVPSSLPGPACSTIRLISRDGGQSKTLRLDDMNIVGFLDWR